jgi:hypothetical protein
MIIKNWLVLLVLTVLLGNFCMAQTDSSYKKNTRKNYRLPEANNYKIFLKTDLSNLLEPDGGFNLGVDVLGKSRFNFSGVCNFVFFDIYRNSSSRSNPRGIKLKPELRFYFLERGVDTRKFYASLEGLLTYTNTIYHSSVNETDSTGNIRFSKRFNYTQEKYVIGLNSKLGYRFKLDKDYDRVLVDIYGGIGIRAKYFKLANNRRNFRGSDWADNIFAFNDDGSLIPSVSLGIKIAYAIK